MVVEQHLQQRGKPFTKNDCVLDDEQKTWIITGPNMGGKSTFLRQNAHIAILAQLGSFVPADSAIVGIVDAVHTRIGAADNLAQDQSTFMVEMQETASILHQITGKSLVIMDEVGRGTASAEGDALASAVLESLQNVRCLFATHFVNVAATAPSSVARKQTKVIDEGKTVIFLHQVVPGVADASHALLVARLAGILFIC